MTFRRRPSGLLKPTHRTGVDWGNPIAQGLKHQLVHTDLGAYDDASGKSYGWQDLSNVAAGQATKKWGTGVQTGNTAQIPLGANSRLIGGANAEVTARWLFQTFTIGSLQCLARSSTQEGWFITATGKIAYYTGSSFMGDSNRTLVGRTVYDIVIRRHGPENLFPDIFINGRADTISYFAQSEFNVTNFSIWGDTVPLIMPGPKILFQAWQRFLSDNEIAALYQEPFQLSAGVSPRRRIYGRVSAGGGAKTLAINAVEGADVASSTLVHGHPLALGAAEAVDTAALAMARQRFLAMGVTEVPDVAALAFIHSHMLAMGVTEAPDVAVLAMVHRHMLALGATEGQDTAAIAATLRHMLVLGAAESVDVASLALNFKRSLAIAAAEGADVASLTLKLQRVLALAASEGPDVAALAMVLNDANMLALAAIEPADTASVALALRHMLAIAAAESPDVASVALTLRHMLALLAAEAQDLAAIQLVKSQTLGLVIGVREATDSAAINLVGRPPEVTELPVRQGGGADDGKDQKKRKRQDLTRTADVIILPDGRMLLPQAEEKTVAKPAITARASKATPAIEVLAKVPSVSALPEAIAASSIVRTLLPDVTVIDPQAQDGEEEELLAVSLMLMLM